MRVLIAVDLNDDDLVDAYGFTATPSASPWGPEWDDALASISARLDEAGYFGSSNVPVRGDLVAACIIDDALPELLDCVEVGVEGVEDDGTANLILGSVQTMRETLE